MFYKQVLLITCYAASLLHAASIPQQSNNTVTGTSTSTSTSTRATATSTSTSIPKFNAGGKNSTMKAAAASVRYENTLTVYVAETGGDPGWECEIRGYMTIEGYGDASIYSDPPVNAKFYSENGGRGRQVSTLTAVTYDRPASYFKLRAYEEGNWFTSDRVLVDTHFSAPSSVTREWCGSWSGTKVDGYVARWVYCIKNLGE